MKKIILSTSILAALFSTSLYAHNEKTESAQVDVLLKTQHSWDGAAYTQYPEGTPELSVLRFKLKPNSILPWHHHPYPNAGYVLKGTLTIQDKDGHKKTYKSGEAFAESVEYVHRGITEGDGATLVLIYAGVQSTPTSISEPGEKPEF